MDGNEKRNMSILKGSEKQCKWAEDIRTNVLNAFQYALQTLCKTEKDKEVIQPRYQAILEVEYAEDLVELFGGIHFTDDLLHNFQHIAAVYRVRTPMTEGQRKILCK